MMKKNYLLAAVLLLTIPTLKAQSTERVVHPTSETPKVLKNELKVNALLLLAPTLDIYYEYLLAEESAIGANLSYHFMDNMRVKFLFSPYYRLYFGRRKPASGFFIEGHLSVLNYREWEYNPNNWSQETSAMFTSVGLGLSVGVKILSRKNVAIDLYGGVGRSLTSEMYYPRFGVNIGKRF